MLYIIILLIRVLTLACVATSVLLTIVAGLQNIIDNRYGYIPSDLTLTNPSPPISFNVSRASDLAGMFDIAVLVDPSYMTASDDDIIAFIFKVEYENEIRYVLQVNYSKCMHMKHYGRLYSMSSVCVFLCVYTHVHATDACVYMYMYVQ